MLDPKEALTKALDYFFDAFPANGLNDVSLESLLLSDDKDQWITTISFKKKQGSSDDGPSSLELLFADKPTKEFRTVRIKSDDGSFIAIESPNTKK